jgi:hypothetical protein
MNTLDSFYLELLRRKCGVPLNQADAGSEFESFYNEQFVSYLLEDASLRHNRKTFMDNLSELPAIFMLARIEVYTILAGAFAKNYNIGSKDGKLEKSQPFEHYNKLIKELTESYQKYGGSSLVRSTPVLLTNVTRNIYKNYVNAPAPTVKVEIVDNAETEVQFKVIPLSSIGVTSFSIYIGEDPIYDLVEVNNISPTSTLVESVPFTTNTYRVTKPTNTIKYLGILAKNKYGRQYLLEVDIEYVPTPPQTGTTA